MANASSTFHAVPPGVIVVDTREPAAATQSLRLAVGLTVPFRREHLASGDYALIDTTGATLGVERKTISDFLGSLADGRLVSQLERMVSDYDHRLLILEGKYRLVGGKVHVGQAPTGWHFSSVQMKLLSIQGRYDLRVLWVQNQDELAETLRALYAQGREGRFHL